MFSSRFLALLLLTTTATTTLFIKQGYASPVTDLPQPYDDSAEQSAEELDDLNAAVASGTAYKSTARTADANTDSSSFKHRDEDQPRAATNLDVAQSMKYDVEILEAGDVHKENIEIEERFKGSAIEVDTDTFVEENIEVHGGEAMQQSHMILTVILVIVALLSIGLYAALVIWRSHLEQRYGMRELLVTDDDFCQQQHNENNSTSGANARHLTIGQL